MHHFHVVEPYDVWKHFSFKSILQRAIAYCNGMCSVGGRPIMTDLLNTKSQRALKVV